MEIENDGKATWITGFFIHLKDVIETEVENVAEPQAKALADQISIMSGHYVHAHMTGCNQVLGNGKERVWAKYTHKWNQRITIDLDLQSADIEAIKNINTSLNERYHYAALGLKAAAYEMDDMAILAFYQSINGIAILESTTKHYEPLRHALSHVGTLRRETTLIPLVNEFGEAYFDITNGGLFDRNSMKNRDNLKSEALKLRAIMMNYFLYAKKS